MTRWVVMPIVTLFTIVKIKVKNNKHEVCGVRGISCGMDDWDKLGSNHIFLLLKVEWIFLLLHFLRSFFSTHKTQFFVAKSFCCIWNFWVKISKFWNAKKTFKKLKTKKTTPNGENNLKFQATKLEFVLTCEWEKIFVCFFSARIKLPW